jgi:GTPase SAR1 family protein
VPYNDGEVLSFEYNMKFFETSARNKINVEEVFGQLIDMIFDKYKNNKKKLEEENKKSLFSIRISEEKIKCCK